MHTDTDTARKPQLRGEDTRAAVIRLNSWPAGLTLLVAAVIIFWLPLVETMIAGP